MWLTGIATVIQRSDPLFTMALNKKHAELCQLFFRFYSLVR